MKKKGFGRIIVLFLVLALVVTVLLWASSYSPRTKETNSTKKDQKKITFAEEENVFSQNLTDYFYSYMKSTFAVVGAQDEDVPIGSVFSCPKHTDLWQNITLWKRFPAELVQHVEIASLKTGPTAELLHNCLAAEKS
jgi:hypothetical protein